jgi:uncharacterized protein YPO0396
MIDTNELLTLKKKAEAAVTEYNQAVGRLSAIKNQIKEAGFNSILEVEAEISRLSELIQQTEADIEARLNAWKAKYSSLINRSL